MILARYQRESATKTNKKVVYCLCEGKNDKTYLEKIKSFISSDSNSNSNIKKYRGSVDTYEIKIESQITDETTFKTKCNDYKNKGDFGRLYWFCDVDFDKDKHQYKYDESNIEICKVNPAIEFFLLLHEKNVAEIKNILDDLTKKYPNYACFRKHDDNKNLKKALKNEIKTGEYIKNLKISDKMIAKVIDKETKWENGNHKNFYSNYGDFLNKEYLLKLNPKLPGK